MRKQEVPSPCIGVCTMDDATGLCKGCYRNLDEVARWLCMQDEQKREVLAELERRRASFGALGLDR